MVNVFGKRKSKAMDQRLHNEIGRHMDAIATGAAWLAWIVYAICLAAVGAAMWS